jgi:hypothetical protein
MRTELPNNIRQVAMREVFRIRFDLVEVLKPLLFETLNNLIYLCLLSQIHPAHGNFPHTTWLRTQRLRLITALNLRHELILIKPVSLRIGMASDTGLLTIRMVFLQNQKP